MVREADRAGAFADLAPLGRPAEALAYGSRPRTSRWSSASGAVVAGESVAPLEARRRCWSRLGRRLRSPPNTSGVSAAHRLHGRRRSVPRARPRRAGRARRWREGWRRRPRSARIADQGPRERHHRAAPGCGPAVSTSSRRSSDLAADERQVRAALVRRDQVRVEAVRASRAASRASCGRWLRRGRTRCMPRRATRSSAAGTPAEGRRPSSPRRSPMRTPSSRSRLTCRWVALRSVVRSRRERQVKSAGSGGWSRP